MTRISDLFDLTGKAAVDTLTDGELLKIAAVVFCPESLGPESADGLPPLLDCLHPLRTRMATLW